MTRSWKRSLVVTLAAAFGVAAIPAVPAGAARHAASLPKCPIGAIKKAAKPVEITMWHSMPEENEKTLQRLADTFNGSQSDVTVKLVKQATYPETLTKYKAGFTSGDLPDVVQIEDLGQQYMIDTQTILPAASCIKADKYDTSDILKRALDYFTVEGTLYAMPFNMSNPIFYYNKQAFEKAGLDPNTPPTTFDELAAAAQKLKDAGMKFPFAYKPDPWYLEQWTAMAGDQLVNNNNGRKGRASKLTEGTKSNIKILTQLQQMVKDGLAVQRGKPNIDVDNLLALVSGDSAMTIDTSSALATAVNAINSGLVQGVTLGASRLPGTVAKKGGNVVGGAGLYIVKKDKSAAVQEAAWRWMKFLDTPQSQATWSVGSGYIPISKAAVDLPEVQQRWAEIPEFKVPYDQISTGANNIATAGAVVGPYEEYRKIVTGGVTEALSGSKSAKAAWKSMAKEAQKAFATYNGRVG